MSVEFPKLLVISAAPINRVDATGITMSNLFAGWPIDRIAQIYDSHSAPDPSCCRKTWRFSSGDIEPVRLAKKVLGRFRASRGRLISVPGKTGGKIQSSSIELELLAVIGDVVPFRVPATLLDWVSEYDPDVIYTLLGSSRMCSLVAQLSAYTGKPVVPHFMDDWPSTLYEGHRFHGLFRVVMNRRLSAVLDRAPIGLAIGADMADVMAARYGKKFDYFMNCVECGLESVRPRAANSDVVRFGYVGGMHLNRWRSLLALSETLESAASAGLPVSLEIYTPAKDVAQYAKLFESFSVVSRISSVPPDQVATALGSFDVLIHAESFLDEDLRYTRFSVSTKIPQYMAAGRAILAIGPKHLSSIRYVEKSNAGLIVTEEGVCAALTDAVRKLAGSESLRCALGQLGYRFAIERHDASVERLRFASVLALAAGVKSD